MHPDCIFGVRLVGLLGRLRLQGPLRWTSTHGHPVACLHTWLLDRGWTLLRPFVWKCEASNDLLDLHDPAWDVRLLQHAARSGWRAWCLRQHALAKRHDSHCADLEPFAFFSQIDVDQVRSWALSCPEARTVSVGASVSPFMLQGRTGVSSRCVWGCGDWGTWDHCAWSCSDRPGVELLPARPAHQLTSRYVVGRSDLFQTSIRFKRGWCRCNLGCGRLITLVLLMHLKLFCLVAGHFPLWGGGFVWLAPFGARFGAASVWGRLHLTKYFFFSRGRRGTWRHLLSTWQAWHLWHWADLETSTFVSRGRRGTYGTGLALVAGDAAALCVAGVALVEIHLRFAWQAWHLVTSTFVLHGRRGAW